MCVHSQRSVLLTVFFCRFMARKLHAFAAGDCMAESADSPMNQEILLGGHFYLMVLKVRYIPTLCVGGFEAVKSSLKTICSFVNVFTCRRRSCWSC